MTTERFNPRFITLALFIVLVAAMRIPNAANAVQETTWASLTPIGAMGLFGGAYFNKTWKALAFPLLTLLISDLAISAFVYDGKYGIIYSGFYWTYCTFAIIVLVGKALLKKVNVATVIGSGIVATLVFWGIMDFIVFLGGATDITTGQKMDHSLASLFKTYAQGAPFARNFLAGTLVYSAILFGAFEWLKKAKPSLALEHNK